MYNDVQIKSNEKGVASINKKLSVNNESALSNKMMMRDENEYLDQLVNDMSEALDSPIWS